MVNGIQVPERIGKYEVLGLLGRGSMGVVYKGFDPEIEREVAIKMLRLVHQDARSKDAPGGLREEARSAGNLRHPNIITVFEVNMVDSNPYIVMDYLPGTALDGLLRSEGPLNPQRVVYYLAQAALGLEHAHSKGIIHCDIKPSNLLLEVQSDTIVILDFGIAKFGSSVEEVDGPVVGTPAYMSPEQIMNEPLDRRTDVFSLSIVGFELLTGSRPFPGSDLTTVMSNILHGNPLSLEEVAPRYLKCESFFQKAFSYKEERYSSCIEMVSDLASVLGFEDPFDAASGMPKVVRPQAIDGDFGQQELRVNFNPADVRRTYSTSSVLSGISPKAVNRMVLFVLPLMMAFFISGVFIYVRAVASRIPEQSPQALPSRLFISPQQEVAQELILSTRKKTAPELLGNLSTGAGSEMNVIFAMKLLRSRGVDLVLNYLEKYLQTGSRVVRVESLKTASEFPVDRAVELVSSGLSDTSPLVRQEAVREIGKGSAARRLHYLPLMPYLALKLEGETSEPVKSEIRRTLERMKDAIKEIEEKLKKKKLER